MLYHKEKSNNNINDKIIEYSFYLLFLLVPLIISPLNTQNPFEFNKLLALYAVTAVIIGAWLAKAINESKISFRPSPLDIPLLGFLLILTLSTIFSTYVPLSLWGSAGLPSGALLPTITMIVLYYAFINHMSEKYKILNSLYILLIAGTLTALYGIAQHYNIDPMLWNLNVSVRAIGTIGQANGLATFLAALLPIPILIFFTEKNKILKGISGILVFIFTLCLLYTNSRSGLIGLGIGGGFLITFLTIYSIKKNEKKVFLTNLLLFTLLIGIIGSVYFTGTKWIDKGTESTHAVNIASSFQQEAVDSTMRSRKYLWKGAIDIWKKYPVLGSGPETFGDQFNLIHTKEANTTSLWNLYSTKAHNEYLHILATTGILGFISYLSIILVFFVWVFSKVTKQILSETKSIDVISLLSIALASGYIIIMITNIWGFSFIPTALLFFLFPAISINSYNLSSSPKIYTLPITTSAQFQKISYLLIPLFICIIWLIEFRIWHADIRYGMGFTEMSEDLLKAEKDLRWAVSLNPAEANYYAELSLSEAYISTKLPETDSEQINYYKQKSIEDIAKSLKINPGNVYLWRKKAQIYYILSSKDSSAIPGIFTAMDETIKRAPNNPIYYHDLAVILDELQHKKRDAIDMLNKSLDLKPDYYEARYYITLLFFQESRIGEGKESLSKLLSLPSLKTEDMESLARQIEKISPDDAKIIKNYLAK